MTTATGRPSRAGGFTLLELMVVLTIMILATAALPFAFQRAFPKQHLQAAAQDLAAHLRMLREQASLQAGVIRFEAYDPPGAVLLDLQPVLFYPDGSSSGARLTLRTGDHVRLVQVSALTGNVEVLP